MWKGLKNDKKTEKKTDKEKGKERGIKIEIETTNKKSERKNIREANDVTKGHVPGTKDKREKMRTATESVGETADRTNTSDGEKRPISGSTVLPKATTAMVLTTLRRLTG